METIELTPVGPSDHARGPGDAPVTLVEYADFQCPYCREAHEVVNAVEQRFTGRLRFVFRQFPLRDIHSHAEAAAEAAEAAAAQGKFWEMHDALFAHQHALRSDDLKRYARAAGVPDPERFDRELDARTYEPVLDAALDGGEASGVDGTPMFFINGQPFTDEPTVDALGNAIDEALGEVESRR